MNLRSCKSGIHLPTADVCLPLLLALLIHSCGVPPPPHEDVVVIGAIRGLLNRSSTYVIRLDGSGQVEYTLPEYLGGQAEWSPDGNWIVYSSLYDVGRPEESAIYLVGANGQPQYQLQTLLEGSLDPTWSPDGNQIAFTGLDAGRGIYTLDVSCYIHGPSCDQMPQYVAPGFRPDWSPDGTRIVYQSLEGHIYVSDVNKVSAAMDLTPLRNVCHDPQWSPSGSQIAFSCYENGHHDIVVLDLTSQTAINLTNGTGSNTVPTWSPDGTRLAFLSTRGELGEVIGAEDTVRSNSLFAMDINGTNVVRLSQRDDERIIWYAWISYRSQNVK